MYRHKLLIAATILGVLASGAIADDFGAGVNQFTIDFVPISGDASSANGTAIGGGATGFVDPGDFCIGVYEITNDQWTKFVNMAGAPTGYPGSAYNSTTTGPADWPAMNVSPLEAFQFVNWLNISSGYSAAYKFVETTPGDPATLTFGVWDAADAAGGTNLFRHSAAKYFIPTEDEWVKAAYWNGTTLQTYASVGDVLPVKQVDSNYDYFGYGLWDVGSGTQELNGTYDMMGNAKEFTESPGSRDGNYDPTGAYGTGVRGGAYSSGLLSLSLTSRGIQPKYTESWNSGFRVASIYAGTAGDFDGDNDVDIDDIDLLADAIAAGSTDLTYDVNGDSVVDEQDLVVHIATLVERTDGGVGTYRGDFNLDGYVDGTDLAILKAGFGLTGLGYAQGNANADDFVNGTDLAIFKATFGFSGTPGAPNPPAVPEPATISLLALGGLAALRRRKKNA